MLTILLLIIFIIIYVLLQNPIKCQKRMEKFKPTSNSSFAVKNNLDKNFLDKLLIHKVGQYSSEKSQKYSELLI